MDRYVCTICGYVYDPEQGDPDNGVAAGTSWEDVPDDWECPVCGAPKDDFEKEQNLEAVSKKGFWFKIEAEPSFNPQEYASISRT